MLKWHPHDKFHDKFNKKEEYRREAQWKPTWMREFSQKEEVNLLPGSTWLEVAWHKLMNKLDQTSTPQARMQHLQNKKRQDRSLRNRDQWKFNPQLAI